MNHRNFDDYAGCLLGGAVGDALGAPVEFLSLQKIRSKFPEGLVDNYASLNAGGFAEFTDDTQMTLFTAEGLLIARERGHDRGIWNPCEAVYKAYLRWLETQRSAWAGVNSAQKGGGWLQQNPAMWKVKAPGNTCLSALASGVAGSPEKAINNSKGCGGVMRVAPIAMMFAGKQAFDEGVKAAALTHGHPSGYLSAGFFAQTLAEIFDQPIIKSDPGTVLRNAVRTSISSLVGWEGHEETLLALQHVLTIIDEGALDPSPETLETLGGGWTGEEALAISMFCALTYPHDYRSAVQLAVTHSGDSDSTGAICGNILGTLNGIAAIPTEWVSVIEMRSEIEEVARKFLS